MTSPDTAAEPVAPGGYEERPPPVPSRSRSPPSPSRSPPATSSSPRRSRCAARPPRQIDARFWPLVIGVTGVVIAIALLAVAITRPAPTREDLERIQPGGVLRVIATIAIAGAFIALWSLGSVILFGYRIEVFPIACALLMAALMLLYGHRRWLSLVIYSAAVTAFVYVVFGMLLRIPL